MWCTHALTPFCSALAKLITALTTQTWKSLPQCPPLSITICIPVVRTISQFGCLTQLTQTSMYKIRLANSATVTFTGPPVAINTALTLSAGWNWIPYVPQEAGPIASAMPSHGYATKS